MVSNNSNSNRSNRGNRRLTTKGALSRKANSAATKRTVRGRKGLRNRKQKVQGKAVRGAQNQLKRFAQGSILAIALTGFLLILLTPSEAGYAEEEAGTQQATVQQAPQENRRVREDLPDSVAIIENIAVDDLLTVEEDTVAEITSPNDISKAAKDEAVVTLRRLWEGFYSNLPKILVALACLLVAWLFVRLLRFILRKTLGHWENSHGIITLVGILTWLFAIGIAISVVAGDIRALLGSLGLIGLALSWSLQTPIESFTGWLLNSFRGYYRVGDRINVGDVFGDVYKIDFLTTTVWEIGAPYRQGFVQAEQPTGRLVTFPNNEILAGTVVNLTGDFPYVWDELAIAVANESDIKLAMDVLERVSIEFMGDYMAKPAQQYQRILKNAGLNYSISEKPQVFISIGESWTDVIIRYLVGARERRKWKSELSIQILDELNKEDYFDRIKSVYPRQQVQIVDPDGKPTDLKPFLINKKSE